MATININNIGRSQTISNIETITTTVESIPGYSSLISSIAFLVTAAEILPFRLTITNIGIEGYRQNNPPGIGVQVIGFSNYIL
jgi:hypothetical protein